MIVLRSIERRKNDNWSTVSEQDRGYYGISNLIGRMVKMAAQRDRSERREEAYFRTLIP